MAQMRQGRWTFSSPALAHDPMRQRVQFQHKAQAKGQGQSGRRVPGDHIPPYMCHPLIRNEGKAARSTSLDQRERKALAQPASHRGAKPASAHVAQPAFSVEVRKHAQQRARTARGCEGEGFVSLRHERKRLKASSCGNAAGDNQERNIP